MFKGSLDLRRVALELGDNVAGDANRSVDSTIEALQVLIRTKKRRRMPVSLPLIPCLTAPMAKHPRLAPPTPKSLNGPST